MRRGPSVKRRDQPWLLVEFIAIARWIGDGEPIQVIATRLQRPIPMVRALVFGEAA